MCFLTCSNCSALPFGWSPGRGHQPRGSVEQEQCSSSRNFPACARARPAQAPGQGPSPGQGPRRNATLSAPRPFSASALGHEPRGSMAHEEHSPRAAYSTQPSRPLALDPSSCTRRLWAGRRGCPTRRARAHGGGLGRSSFVAPLISISCLFCAGLVGWHCCGGRGHLGVHRVSRSSAARRAPILFSFI